MRARWAWAFAMLVLFGGPCHGEAGEDLLSSLLKDLGLSAQKPPEDQGSQISRSQLPAVQYMAVTYNKAMQPIVTIKLGGHEHWQTLDLVFSTRSGNTFVFAKERGACSPKEFERCYSLDEAMGGKTMMICQENANRECEPGKAGRYDCQTGIANPKVDNLAHSDQFVIDSVQYSMKGVEARDVVFLELRDFNDNNSKPLGYEVTTPLPFRILLSKLETPPLPSSVGQLKPSLFEGTSGLFGAGGASLSCRIDGSIWYTFLQVLKFATFRLDFHPPERARLAFAAAGAPGPSKVVFNPPRRNETIWSEPKQLGDYLHNGVHGFMLYHLSVCKADLLQSLRNTSSSNWFAVIDTTGPCLTLPAFLFDRLMVHIPVTCPFDIGQPSLGRLCSPDRTRSQKRSFGSTVFNVSLPAVSFTLEDERRIYEPVAISLPLERLVFDADPDGSGDEELLCVARSDTNSWDMMYSYISFGSLAVAAVSAEIDQLNFRIGLTSHSNVSLEATDAYCAEKPVCESHMQEYDESSNQCVDPECSRYMFMVLDHERKVCTWSGLAPVALGIAITSLVMLDLFSHKLYKQAIEKAGQGDLSGRST